MNGAIKKFRQVKRVIAWLLTAAIVSGNVSQLSATTVYAAENTERKTATSSNASKATPSGATPSEAKKVIDVKITQSAIEKVLKKDEDRRPELKEDLIPFKGEQKDLVIEKLYEELEGKTLIQQKKSGKAMYLVVVTDDLDGEPFAQEEESDRIKQESILESVQIIGVNGYKDRECEFHLRVLSDKFVITNAQMDEYAVVGENEEESSSLNATATGGGNSSDLETKSEIQTKADETIQQEESKTEESKTEEIKLETEAETKSEDGDKMEEPNSEAVETEDEAEESEKEEIEDSKEDSDSKDVKEIKTDEKDEGKAEADSEEIRSKENDAAEEKNQELSISKHPVKTLFLPQETISTSSEAVFQPEDYEDADLVSVLEGRVLTSEEKSALMGTKDEEEEGFHLTSLLSQPSFSMVVSSYGITLLNMEVSDEDVLTPYETALTYYGPDATDQKDTVEIRLDQNQTGEIKAGKLFTYTITYTMQASPLYEYPAGGKLSLFDTYEHAVIYFTVPAGIHLEEQEGKVKLNSSDETSNIYEIKVGDENHSIRPGKSDSIKINAYVSENGARAVGESFSLAENSVAFHAEVKVADKTDKDNITYPGNIETVTYAKQPEQTQLKLISDDVWHIKKSIYPSENSYTIVKDEKDKPQYVEIKYLVEVGMYGDSGEISRDPGGTIYQTYGRTGFNKDSYRITDSLSITTPDAPNEMKPSSVTATWGDGSPVSVTQKEDGSIVIDQYKTQGQDGADHIYVSSEAPTYSSYLITARYPYEPFVLKYNDPRVTDSSVFTVLNQAHLEYVKLGTTERMTDDSEASIAVHEANKPAVIEIKKMIDEGIGVLKPYNKTMEREYPGLSEFQIYSVDDLGKLIPYSNYRVIDRNGSNLNSSLILVNPSNEVGEDAPYITGDEGSIRLQADPGTYVIKEEKKPTGTEFSYATLDSKTFQSDAPITISIKAGEKKEVTVVNNVIGKGAIEFYKKARNWNNLTADVANLPPLEGAEFTLYVKEGDALKEVTTVQSDNTGLVRFKPLTPGEYVVREKSANGYILDTKEYPVTVRKGETSVLKQEDNFLINTLNQAKIQVTKLLLKDSGAYDKVPNQYRGDFDNHFWFESSLDGSSWSRVTVDKKDTFSLNGDSRFEAVLPIYDGVNRLLRYRVVEELPEGYSNGNLTADGFTTAVVNEKTYVYKEFTLTPLTTTSFDIKNDRKGTLTLQKETWTFGNEWNSGWIEKGNSNQGYQFKLYASDKNGTNYTEVTPDKTYVTNEAGNITARDLDINLWYYWGEIGSDDRLEAEETGKTIGGVEINGVMTSLIGPFTVSRESVTSLKAYNIPQKVPYWLHKYDITDNTKSIEATFRITKKSSKEVVFEGNVKTEGTFVVLDPQTTYLIEETEPPKNYVGDVIKEITTPSGPITKAQLEEWFWYPKELTTTHLKFYNKPYKVVNLKKIIYNSDGTQNKDTFDISFEVYKKENDQFTLTTLPDGTNSVWSNTDTIMAPGIYYFKEQINPDIINPLFLLTDKSDGPHGGYEIKDGAVYYGPVTVTAAETASDKKMELNLGDDENPLMNYQNYGRVSVTKKNALTNATLNGAVLGIFLESEFHKEDWETSIKNPIETGTSGSDGKFVFGTGIKKLKIFDENGNRISYVIAEITPPTNYLPSDEVLTTTLTEGKTITTVNGDAAGAELVIKDEPKLTIRAQKYWKDSWNDQFYDVNRVLGNVKMALYKVNKDQPETADLVTVQSTNAFDGIATFYDINRNDTYYVAEVSVPTKSETKLPFDLNMGDKKPLPLASGQPAKILLVTDLDTQYNAVKFTGKDLPNNDDSLIRYTDPLYNYKSWVQFNVWKTCDGITLGGDTHEKEMVNGARFTLYKMISDTKNLSGIRLNDLTDESRFEVEGQYESGTRMDPETGKRLSGQFDTTILEAGYVYWLVEEEAAPGYELEEGEKIAAVFVPDSSGYSGHQDIMHPYVSGRNEEIAVIENHHSQGGGGFENYHFQVALNKWLKDDSTGKEPTLLGGAKFKLWLLDPENNEKLLPIDVMETGLESDSTYKTGYALSKIIRLNELSDKLLEMGKDPKKILITDADGDPVKAVLGLEEIYAPSKVTMDPTLHRLSVTIPINNDYIDDQYFWDSEKTDEAYRLINRVSKEYPVLLKKYGYIPDSGTFGKTDEELDGMNFTKTPLAGVSFEVWQYQWSNSGYTYKKYGTYKTNQSGQFQIPDGLPAGHYRIKETLTAEQKNQYITMYTGSGGLWRYFTVGNSAVTVPVYNPEKPKLELEKTAWNGEKPEGLEGITFAIKASSGKVITADTKKQEDGRYLALFSGLDSGTYTILTETLGSSASQTVTNHYFKQTSIAIGYQPIANGENVTLVPLNGVTGQNVALTIQNPRLAQLTLYKTDAETKQSGSALKGASFHLEYQKFRDADLEGGILKNVEDPTYDKPSSNFEDFSIGLADEGNGSYVLKNCVPGWYRITEAKAPDGYTVATAPLVVAVTGDMSGTFKNTEVTFENRKKAALTITKKLIFGDGFKNDPDISKQLPNQVVFDVYTYSEPEKTYKPVYDENGQPVTVTIKNFAAADGYYTADGTVLLPQNPDGASYYVKERENPNWMLTGAENGTLWSKGYIEVGTKTDFTTSTPVAVGVENQYAKAKIRLTKVDADTKELLTGAAFSLYSDPGLTAFVGAFKESVNSGIYEIVFSTKTYSPGTYYVKETNAPSGYLPIQTALPEQGLTVETGKTTEITVENHGGMDFKITKYSGNGESEAVKEGITFELYKKEAGGSWNFVSQNTTDSKGNLSFRGLNQEEGYSYGVYEVPVKDQGFDTFRIESFEGEHGAILPIIADLIKDGETNTGRTLFVLSDTNTKAPGVYQFTVHNQEALPLKLFKNDADKQENPSNTIRAFIKITDKETQKQVGDIVEVPYGETGTTVMLLPGIYELEETAITSNTDGYVINPDDSRTVYKKEVTIEKGKVPSPCAFTNVKQKTGVSLEKTTQTTSLKDLWWNNGQTVTYTLTPGAVNSIPLDQYVITDSGLTMLDSGKSVLDEAEYTNEKYTILSVKPQKATQQNHLKEGTTGTIMADVTFYGFDGSQIGEVKSVNVSGDGEIGEVKPSSTAKVKSFQISYRDDTLKESTKNHYVLGQDFVPGSILVTAKLDRQDATLTNGSYKKEIKYVRNQAEVSMNYRKWDINGNLNPGQETTKADAICDITVVQSQAPVLSVSKNVDPIKGVQPGTQLTYTLTVTNATTSSDSDIAPIQKPVLIDLVPQGVTVSGESTGEDRLLKAVTLERAPAGVSIEKTIRKINPDTGQETLFIQLNGNLNKGETVTVSVKATIAGNIINYGKNILNTLFVTSDVLQPAFSLNQTGASFMIHTSSGTKWPSRDLPASAMLSDEKYRTYGYASDSAENTMSTGTGIQLYKEVKGNLDTRFVSGTTSGKVAKSAEDTELTKYDGTVLYRLMVNNASDLDYVSQLQLMDILPVKGDFSTGNISRLSDFRLKFEHIQSIAIENRKDGDDPKRKVKDFNYEITYSNEVFDDKKEADAGKDAMLNDNASHFWSQTSGDPTAIRIKITDPAFYLEPGENLVVTYQTVVPYTTAKELEETAYGYAVNDFASAYSYKEGGSSGTEEEFPQVQTSNPVQVLLVPGNVKVSGRIWIDDDDDGIQNEDVEKDHLLTDLFPLLENNYFHVSLLKYSKNGDDQTTMVPGTGDARFLFDELTPAKPFGITGSDFTESEEDDWYQGSSLLPDHLKGEDPAHYQILVDAGTMPKGLEDLILKLAKPNMFPEGENKKAGRSRLPKSLLEGGANYNESRDSNFSEMKNGYSSEDFFLWSTAGEYDTTKDIGFVPYRNVTVKKTNQAKNPVEGAHFTVYGPFTNQEMDGFLNSTVTSDAVLGSPAAEGTTKLSSGEALWNAGDLLYYRNYIIVEDEAPKGYQVADASSNDMELMNSYEVPGKKAWVLKSKEFKTADDSIPSTVTVEDSYITGSLEFTKTDGLTNENLSGAVFQIKQKEPVVEDAWNALIAAMRTNGDTMGITDVMEVENGVTFKVTNGTVTITGLPLGSYTLAEIKVPDGYDITKKLGETEFAIRSEGEKAALNEVPGNIIPNTRTQYSLSIKKKDDAGNEAVKGIKFSITGPGKYESSTWNPFNKNKFKLNDPEQSGYEVKETGEDGVVTWNLPYGDYKLTELEATGYHAVEPFYVRVGLDGTVSLINGEDRPELVLDSQVQNTINVIVTNHVRTAPIVIEKVDGESKTPITGAWFTLSGTSLIEGAFEQYLDHVTGSGISYVTTSKEDGTLSVSFRVDGINTSKQGTLSQIPYGTYTLKEIKAPDGYLFGGSYGFTKELKLETPEGIAFTGEQAVINTPHKLVIEKRDKETDALLTGAEFVLLTSEGAYVSLDEENSFTGLSQKEEEGTSFTTGSDGTVTIKRLPAGTYVLKERKAPVNYSVSADTEITVLEAGNTERIRVYDERDRAKILINKAASHDHNKVLSGAVFEIYSDQELTALAGTMTTGADGKGKSDMLPLGTYYVKEKTAPDGYEAGSRIYEVTLKSDRERSTVTADGSEWILNDYGTGNLVFDKIDATSLEPLAGAEFSLTNNTVQVEGAFEDFVEKMINLTAKEQSDMGIADVKKDGNSLRFTEENGRISISKIPYGSYTLKEEKAPEGYLSLNNAEFVFALSANQTDATISENNQVKNDRAQFELKLKKVDNLQRSVSGIGFYILGPGRYDEGGLLSVFGASSFHTEDDAANGTFVTGADGTLTLGLKHGDYQIREVSTDRYHTIEPFYIRVDEKGKVSLLKDDSKAVTVENGDTVTLTVTNQIRTGSVSLQKVDSEDLNKNLEGAEFTLTNVSTLVPGTWQNYRYLAASYGASWTNEQVKGDSIAFTLSGKAVISNLPYGTYRITETKAPNGYLLGSSPWSREFTLSQSEPEVKYERPGLFTNTKGAIENQPSKIIVYKTNAVYADTKLSGAEFVIKASNGSYVTLNNGSFAGYSDSQKDASRFVTDSNGEYTLKRLPVDTYTIIESKAPAGYRINHSIPTVTLDGRYGFTITIQDQRIRGGGGDDDGGGGGSNPRDSVTIIPDPVPLANLPGDSHSVLVTIDDGNVPLAKLPKTGERKANAGKVMVALSGFMLALYAAINKKKKQDG